MSEFLQNDHFEGNKNTSKGQEKGRQADLATLLNNVNRPLLSAATAGGAADEALAVEGLKADDEIVAVVGAVVGGNSVAVAGWSAQVAGQVMVHFTADPGAGNKVNVLVRRKPKV